MWPNIAWCCWSKAGAELCQVRVLQRLDGAGDGDLVALTGIAHVERALDADVICRKAIIAQFLERLRHQPLEHAVHVRRRDLARAA